MRGKGRWCNLAIACHLHERKPVSRQVSEPNSGSSFFQKVLNYKTVVLMVDGGDWEGKEKQL